VGTLLDTTVFIELERAVRSLPANRAMTEVTARLTSQLGATEETGIAAITASELLHGVHRAIVVHRPRREAFVEGVLAAFPPLPFDLIANTPSGPRANTTAAAIRSSSSQWKLRSTLPIFSRKSFRKP